MVFGRRACLEIIMKNKIFSAVTLFCGLLVISLSLGTPVTKEIESLTNSITDDIPTTTPSWIRFLKAKKIPSVASTAQTEISTSPVSPEQAELTTTESTKVQKPSKPLKNSLRAIPEPNKITASDYSDAFLQWLQSLSSSQSPNSVLSQERLQNPDSLYDEYYLDWMKRDLGSEAKNVNNEKEVEEEAGQDVSQASDPSGGQVQATPSYYTYPYATVPLTPFYPAAGLAGFKLQKAMAQAQVDAALSAMNLATTPKPMKLKLKITVPGTVGLAELGQIGSGLSSVLPPGSTYELS